MTYFELLVLLNGLSNEQMRMPATIVTPNNEFVEIEGLCILEEYIAKSNHVDYSDILGVSELDQPIMEVSL